MKIKKAFTLAEIMISISVVSVIAVMTIPGLLKSTTEKQYRMGLKKCYNTLASSYATARIKGMHPMIQAGENYAETTKYTALRNFYISMLENMQIREITRFKPNQDQGKIDTKKSSILVTYYPTPTSTTPKTVGINTTGSSSDNVDLTKSSGKTVHTWITTEDGLSYYLINDRQYRCQSKRVISSNANIEDMINNSCIALHVDVNGIHKGPNIYEPTYKENLTGRKTPHLTGDMYYLFVGSDGISAGNSDNFISARIIEDIK